MKKLDIVRITPLRGPNIWTYRPALEAWVDIGDLEDYPSNTLPGFVDRLVAWLPSIVEHKCSIGERGGFIQRLREGTWAAHILEHVTLELQNLAGQRTGFGKARSTSVRGLYKVVVRSRQEEVTRCCLENARQLILAAIEDRQFDVDAAVAEARKLADRLCLGPSTACIVDAAAERGIPAIRLTEGNLVQLGYGARSRRIWTAESDRTSAIAESIASNKDLTKRLLASCGVPIPEGREVDSPEDAWDAAEDIGLPVVVKPTDANHGRGVFTDLNTREEVEKAYAGAVDEGSGVMVERFVRGNSHRLLVVGNKVVAAIRGKVQAVVGDGHASIAELVESQINSDPRCGVEEEFPLEPLVLAEEPIALLELERQGYTIDSVPPRGQEVLIKRQGDLAYDETDDVHPAVAAAAALAARIVGLDIAGLDIVAEDVARPLEETRGAIVEVNAGPSLLMHLKPAEGKPRPVGEAIASHLFPKGENGRIPIVGITGSKGKTTVARLLADLVQLTGLPTGLACSEGSFLGTRCLDKADGANWAAGHRMLINRAVEVAILETGARSIVAEGLAYDRCQVAVVTNIDPADQVADRYVETPEQLVNVLRTLVDVVLAEGVAVLNADDPLVAPLAPLCDGEVIFFSLAHDNPVVAQHRAQGRRAVVYRDGTLLLASGEQETMVSAPAAIDVAQQPGQAASFAAAAAAAWALAIAPDLIRAGIETHNAGRSVRSARKT
ncbi:MAG: cyanophycin synthetase [Rhodocyclales bacterium]|nr:cyanophycin synthetase [Rhodocyclales bacterium]